MVGCPPDSGPFSLWCASLDADEIGPYIVTFDSNDQFNVVQNIDGADETYGETYGDFKENLEERDTLEVDLARGSEACTPSRDERPTRTRCQVLGVRPARCQVPGARCQVPGQDSQVLDTPGA